jgi:hypothetical protein
VAVAEYIGKGTLPLVILTIGQIKIQLSEEADSHYDFTLLLHLLMENIGYKLTAFGYMGVAIQLYMVSDIPWERTVLPVTVCW